MLTTVRKFDDATHLAPSKDGGDAALIRFSLVDERGVRVSNSEQDFTFEVVQGPGRVVGVGAFTDGSYSMCTE